jgi:hypothetical protein
MNAEPLTLPEACSFALARIEADPLTPGPEVESHLRQCRACAEARVAYLAQEPAPEVLAPAGYFERLPDRLLRKLPARPRPFSHLKGATWAAAAALLMAVGAGAFWAGRANRTPYVEASLPKAPVVEPALADAPFQDADGEAAQVQALSPAEMKALLKRLDTPAAADRR